MTTPHSQHRINTRPTVGLGMLASLRTKFVLFFSLILIVATSILTWYFIESKRMSMTENLNQLGTILLTSVVNNGQFRFGALMAEDAVTLRQFTESLMAVDDVVYVVIRGSTMTSSRNKTSSPGSHPEASPSRKNAVSIPRNPSQRRSTGTRGKLPSSRRWLYRQTRSSFPTAARTNFGFFLRSLRICMTSPCPSCANRRAPQAPLFHSSMRNGSSPRKAPPPLSPKVSYRSVSVMRGSNASCSRSFAASLS